MAAAWRLSPAAFARALDGEGNRKVGARWNSPGRGVVYTSANLSLCVLETYVHFGLDVRSQIPDFEAVRLALPGDAPRLVVSDEEFNDILRQPRPEAAFRRIGDEWLARAEHLILQAPSIIVPEDANIIINPAHPAMRDVHVASSRRFRFDPRLSSGR